MFRAHFGPGSETLGDNPFQYTRQREKTAFVNEQARPSIPTPQAIARCSKRLWSQLRFTIPIAPRSDHPAAQLNALIGMLRMTNKSLFIMPRAA